jgi:hypothetical protein
VGITRDEAVDIEGDKVKIEAAPGDKVIYSQIHLLNGGSDDMAVNGATTNVVFSAGPSSGQIWYVEKILLHIEDSGNNLPGNFGAISGGLTNGVLVQQRISSTDYDYTNLQDNSDIVEAFSDNYLRGQSTAFLNSSTYFSGISKMIIPITLDGDNGDLIKTTVRDNLTGLNTFHFSLEYYRVVT